MELGGVLEPFMDVSLVDRVWMSRLETLYGYPVWMSSKAILVWILCMGMNIPCMFMDILLRGHVYCILYIFSVWRPCIIHFIDILFAVYYTSR